MLQSFVLNYLEGLNPEQKEAVLTTEGPVAVLAGAGSGKTRVLTHRIYHLVRRGVEPGRILAVTFTNKAAREMRERVWGMLGGDEKGSEVPVVVTFHALGIMILKRWGTRIGVPHFFGVFDRDDSVKIINAILKEMDIDPKVAPPRALLARISREKGAGTSVEAFQEKSAGGGFSARLLTNVWKHYEAALAKEKTLDFDDLIARPLHLLESFDDARKEAEAWFDYLHVDEYQDTNELQGRLANLLVKKHQNLFVVGDIDQTIYTWRGATIENLLAFEEKYPNARTIILTRNYRSTETIVEAANAVIEKNKNRKEKVLIAEGPRGEKITMYVASSGDEEARWVSKTAQELIKRGTKPSEIAVLFRTNAQSRAFEEAFLNEGIPYRVLGTRFFERKEIKNMLAWARLALDPTRSVDFVRAVQAPARGIGKVTLGKIVAGKRGELRALDASRVERFEATIRALGESAKRDTASGFIRRIAAQSGIEEALKKEGEEGRDRLENVRELATFAARHDRRPGEEGIVAFLEEAALASDQDDPGDERGATLMTVHAAKGLEFDAVFIAGLEEGLFPHERMDEEETTDKEEERRLFYVALTRARKRLFLSLALVRRVYGTEYLTEPSSFLDDIDTALIKNTHEHEEAVIEA